MERKEVYYSIDTEREYQVSETENPNREDMVSEFDMAHALLCIDRFIKQATDNWYKDTPTENYSTVTPILRKIAGVCVSMGEKYGMPTR